MELSEFLSILNTPHPAPMDFALRQGYIENATNILTLLSSQSSAVTEEVKHTLHQHLSVGSRHPSPFLRALCHSALFRISGKLENIQQTLRSTLDNTGDLSETNANLNGIADLLFNDHTSNLKTLYTEVSSLSRSLLDQAIARADAVLDSILSNNPTSLPKTKDRIVIITAQLLTPPHAPTVCSFLFSRILQEEHGKEVLIINSKEFAPEHDGCFCPPFTANLEERHSQNPRQFHDGCIHSVFQTDGRTYDEENLKQIYEKIIDFAPEMILSVGTRCITAEALATYYFTMMYPTQTGLPLTQRLNFHTWQAPTEAEHRLLIEREQTDQWQFHQYPGFEEKLSKNQRETLSHDKKVARRLEKISDEQFTFAIVGMRLDQDVKSDFLETLDAIAAAAPRSLFLFIGNFSTYVQIIGNHPRLKHHCRFLGFQTDITPSYKLCDAYISPRRSGGGSAVTYALEMDMPCLCFPEGDAGEAVKLFPPMGDYTDMAKQAVALVNDPTTYEQYQTIARRAFADLPKRSTLVAKILTAFEAANK